MSQIALPKKIEVQPGENPNEAEIIIEPCFPGYGITLGNSIRRVMLSSLPGAAPVGVKIKGADHEFMALPNVKEDILEIILNLKNIRLKVHTDQVEKLELEVHGKKNVTAADFKKNSNVEVVNQGQEIATVTDMSGSLQLELFVSRGMGYEMIENRENKSSELGYIEMDSVFSPVVRAGVKVDNVRVGKMTNWDKITLDVRTDGTIEPDAAFAEAVKILIDQFKALLEAGASPAEPANKAAPEAPEEKDEEPETTEEEAAKEEESEEEEPKKKRGRPKKEE